MKRAGVTAITLSILISLLAGCHGHPPVSPIPDPSLEPRADQEAHAAAPDGQRLGQALWGVAYGNDQFTDFRIPLEAGNCYWFGFAGDNGIGKFSMYIWGPTDKRLDSTRGRPPQGVFKHCALENGTYRLEGKVGEGAGHFAVVVYKTQGPTVVVAAPAPKLDLTAIIEAQAAAAAPGATRVGDFFAGTADTSDWYAPMEVGKCYWVIGAGEAGKVKRLFIYLWDPQNKRVTESKSDSSTAMVGHCPKDAAGMYKFQAKVDSGSGPYKVGLYVK
jgi:hypothetical protein